MVEKDHLPEMANGSDPGRSSPEPERAVEVHTEVLNSQHRPLYPLETRKPEALVIHCGDPRFQTAFRRFITEELGIASYAPVIIGGGVHAFGAQSFLPKNFKILWQQVKFFVKEGGINQIIIINHEDCTWYDKMKGYGSTLDLPLRGKLDLQTAARVILKDFARVQVRTFWAGIDDGRVSFREITDR
ncbi:MAG: hypothetical protein KKA42_04310 [candidate division Zixibacteria bacterium]|nr:hypothetical protein [candidate division Zixibacteria bacterium]